MEKRKSERIILEKVIEGKIQNIVKCNIQNISLRGLKFISTFMPKLNQTYRLNLIFSGRKKEFKISIVRAEALPMDESIINLDESGLYITCGAVFEELDRDAEKFLAEIIGNGVVLDSNLIMNGSEKPENHVVEKYNPENWNKQKISDFLDSIQ